MEAIKSNEMAWGSKKEFRFQWYEGKFITEHPRHIWNRLSLKTTGEFQVNSLLRVYININNS